MPFKQISFLLKGRSFYSNKELIVREAKKILEEMFTKEAIEDLNEINYRPPVLFIKTNNPALKSEIMIKQEQIFERLREFLENANSIAGEIKKII